MENKLRRKQWMVEETLRLFWKGNIRSRRKIRLEPHCPQNGGLRETAFCNSYRRNKNKKKTNGSEALQRMQLVLRIGEVVAFR
jgi:hypothetical protein